MNTNDKPLADQTDRELLNKVVPRWAQTLNWVYEHTFGPVDRFIDHLKGAGTRQMIADFEAAEARKAARSVPTA